MYMSVKNILHALKQPRVYLITLEEVAKRHLAPCQENIARESARQRDAELLCSGLKPCFGLVDSNTKGNMRPLHSLFITFAVLLAPIAAYTSLSDITLRNLPWSGNDFNIKDGVLLAPILRPRVPGTPGSTAVLNHFVDFFKTELPEWTIEFQNSTSRTPATGNSEIPFVNMIATRDPPWTKPGEVGRLALVAHYDSKLTPTGFIGATDSAAPCAMLMHAAKSVDMALTKKWAAMKADGGGEDTSGDLDEEKGVQIIFLDGEEAFVNWSDSDSLYGAR